MVQKGIGTILYQTKTQRVRMKASMRHRGGSQKERCKIGQNISRKRVINIIVGMEAKAFGNFKI